MYMNRDSAPCTVRAAVTIVGIGRFDQAVSRNALAKVQDQTLQNPPLYSAANYCAGKPLACSSIKPQSLRQRLTAAGALKANRIATFVPLTTHGRTACLMWNAYAPTAFQ